MELIPADHDRRLQLPDVPGLVRRPVDIDRSRTGFANLRSLRIYRFDAQSVIHGQAEEDEVFVVVLTGSIEFSVREPDAEGASRSFVMKAVSDSHNVACVAYLAPYSAYQLTPQTDADVAYARATPIDSRPSTVFTSNISKSSAGVAVLLEEVTYARCLRLRLLQIDALEDDVTFIPTEESVYEVLVHLQTVPAEQAATVITSTKSTQLTSWDTISLAPGDRPTLSVAKGSSALVLVVSAA